MNMLTKSGRTGQGNLLGAAGILWRILTEAFQPDGSALGCKPISHGWNTDKTRIRTCLLSDQSLCFLRKVLKPVSEFKSLVRVSSVFHPWQIGCGWAALGFVRFHS
jgi:hypothetical protein